MARQAPPIEANRQDGKGIGGENEGVRWLTFGTLEAGMGKRWVEKCACPWGDELDGHHVGAVAQGNATCLASQRGA